MFHNITYITVVRVEEPVDLREKRSRDIPVRMRKREERSSLRICTRWNRSIVRLLGSACLRARISGRVRLHSRNWILAVWLTSCVLLGQRRYPHREILSSPFPCKWSRDADELPGPLVSYRLVSFPLRCSSSHPIAFSRAALLFASTVTPRLRPIMPRCPLELIPVWSHPTVSLLWRRSLQHRSDFTNFPYPSQSYSPI